MLRQFRPSVCPSVRLSVINSNFGPILHRFWDTASYWLNIANFSYPTLVWRPRSAGSSQNFWMKLTAQKLEGKLHDPNFSRFWLTQIQLAITTTAITTNTDTSANMLSVATSDTVHSVNKSVTSSAWFFSQTSIINFPAKKCNIDFSYYLRIYDVALFLTYL